MRRMEYKVKVFDEAEKHLKRISAYIFDELKAPQAAENVMDDLEQAIISLRSMPERIPLSRDRFLKSNGLHCMVVRKYLIYFQIDEEARQVNVISVIYGKRDQVAQMEALTAKN